MSLLSSLLKLKSSTARRVDGTRICERPVGSNQWITMRFAESLYVRETADGNLSVCSKATFREEDTAEAAKFAENLVGKGWAVQLEDSTRTLTATAELNGKERPEEQNTDEALNPWGQYTPKAVAEKILQVSQASLEAPVKLQSEVGRATVDELYMDLIRVYPNLNEPPKDDVRRIFFRHTFPMPSSLAPRKAPWLFSEYCGGLAKRFPHWKAVHVSRIKNDHCWFEIAGIFEA